LLSVVNKKCFMRETKKRTRILLKQSIKSFQIGNRIDFASRWILVTLPVSVSKSLGPGWEPGPAD